MIYWSFLLLVWYTISPPPAHAYLDPGSGSMMVQLLLAGFAGLAIAAKVFWRRIKSFFTRSKDGKTNSQ